MKVDCFLPSRHERRACTQKLWRCWIKSTLQKPPFKQPWYICLPVTVGLEFIVMVAKVVWYTVSCWQWSANLKSQSHCKISDLVFKSHFSRYKFKSQIPKPNPKSQSQNSKSQTNLKSQSFFKTIKQHDCVKYRMLLANVIASFSNVMKLSLCHSHYLEVFRGATAEPPQSWHLVGFCVHSSSSPTHWTVCQHWLMLQESLRWLSVSESCLCWPSRSLDRLLLQAQLETYVFPSEFYCQFPMNAKFEKVGSENASWQPCRKS